VLLVSDASGQMAAQNEPSGGILGGILRADSTLQARVRAAQYHELAARRRASLLRGLMFVHLKKDLEVHPVDWIGCEQPEAMQLLARREAPLTSYGIRKDVQERLAAIRTDLDSFCDAEAYALMTSGYRMTEHEFPRRIEGFAAPAEARPPWRFLALEEPMKRSEGSETLLQLLDVAREPLFKIVRLSRPLQVGAGLLGLAALVGLLWLCRRWAAWPVLTLGMISGVVAVTVASLVVGKMIGHLVRFRETLIRVALGIGMSLLGWLAARLYLHLFDGWYLRLGRLERMVRRGPLAPRPQPVAPTGAVPPVP
jgi:hypothetical protein